MTVYSQVQESKKDKNDESLKPLKMNNMSNDEAIKLVEPIREDKIKETIAKLKNNKSPGTDGFAGEFYKANPHGMQIYI